MRLFSSLYDRAMRWSVHPHAQYYLAGLSFAESSFFPIPPDVMLAPMSLARRDRAFWYATLTTLASVAGGLAGYAIGYFALTAVTPLLQDLGYWENYLRVQVWFQRWGFWAILVAGFSPIPYKLFTIAGGALGLFLPTFLLGSFIGRGGRFFLVATLMVLGGEKLESGLRRYIDVLGWVTIAALVTAYFVLRH